MRCRNPHLDIYKLSLLGAIMVVIGDFLELLVAYQEYCDNRDKKNNNTIGFEERIESQRLLRRFG